MTLTRLRLPSSAWVGALEDPTAPVRSARTVPPVERSATARVYALADGVYAVRIERGAPTARILARHGAIIPAPRRP